jgi:hypothetical protein
VSACVSDKQNRKDFQLDSTDNVQNATLGKPMKMMELRPDKVCLGSNYADIFSFLVPLDSYIFPVRFKGEIKLLFTITRFAGQSQFGVDEIGSAPIAREINKIEKKWPVVKGRPMVLCANFQTMTYAFSIPEISRKNLTIITPAASGEKNSYVKLSSVEQTIKYLKTILGQAY